MVDPVTMEAFGSVSKEVGAQVKRYLLGELDTESKFTRKNSSSSEESEKQFCKTTEKKEHVGEWDEWGEKEESALEADESVYNWLFRCDLKTYLDGEYLLVSWESRFVVLRKAPDDTLYKIVCKQCVEGDPVATEITASCIFGLSNVRHSDLLDSIIISLGTLDGHVYFYTEKGILLYFDRFSIFEPVNNLLFEVVKTGQTFLVVLSKTFFAVNPISLKSVLYQSKMLIAKGEKTVQQISDSIELQSELLAPYIKGNIIHVVFTGLHKPTTFDQYVSAAYDSFYAKVEKPVLPTYSTFLVTTEKEFATFVWHDREEQDKLLADVIKYGKSLVPSFGIRKFFGISTEPMRVSSHMRSATHAPTRGSILEPRIAQNVMRSPSCQYVAITDRLARVLVVDIPSRQVVLLYKGYRDATISWVSTSEGDRFTEFLIIFAPRRSLLEVWTVLGNVRVCAQHVASSECNLVSGGENKMLCGQLVAHSDHTSFFLDENGEFHRLVLPFHLALTSRDRQDQHDNLIIRDLEAMEKKTSEEFYKTFEKLKMSSSRSSMFQSALHTLESVEEAHHFIARIRSISSVEIVNVAEKSVGFYARILNETAEKSATSSESSRFELDPIVQRILECHLERLGDSEVEDEGVLTVGEWFRMIDLEKEDVDVYSEPWTDSLRSKLSNLIFSPLFTSSFPIDEFYDTVLEKLPVSRRNIVRLLIAKLERSHLDWKTFDRIVDVFLNLEKQDDGKILELVDQMAMDSKSVTSGMILMTMCWCARKEMKRQKLDDTGNSEDVEEEEGDDVRKEKKSDEWDAVSPEVEHIDSIIMCLHCVALSQTLLDKDDVEKEGFRVADYAQRLDSYIREMVAKWIVNESIDEETIEKLFPRDPAENLFEEGDEEDRRRQMTIDIPDDKLIVIERMYQMIPRVFEHDLVVADVCWEMMSRWFRDKDYHFSLLSKCTSLLPHSLVNARLRHGIARLIWDKFVGAAFQSVVQMVEKTGRRPKDRETRKEIGLGETKLEEFLAECEKFLGVLMEAVRDQPPVVAFNQDLLVEMATSSFSSHLSKPSAPRQDQLSVLAARQPLVNFHLVLHHQHLALTLRLQLTVGLRFHPLRNLFCVTGNRAFFVPLDSHPLIPLDHVDDAILEKRHAFLVKVAEQGSVEERRLARDLEMEWKLTVNEISFMQALSSYRLGNDQQGALELAVCVRDDRSAVALARVLAARLLQLGTEANKRFSTAHSQYLCSLAGEEAARVELYADEQRHQNPKTWREAVTSLGRAGNALPQSTHAALPFVKMNDIARLYFGAHWN